MVWILLATVAQFLNAVVAILDKYIVTEKSALPKPFVYAFYSCLVSGAWILVYAFGALPLASLEGLYIPSFAAVENPSLTVVAFSFLAAYTFFFALVSLYSALKAGEASDVMPVAGAVSAIASFGLGYQFLGQSLSPNFVFGIILLIIGMFLVVRKRLTKSVAFSSLHAGVFFALHFVTMKGLFLETTFDNAFFWSRIGFVLFALTLLLVPSYFRMIFDQTKTSRPQTGFLIIFNKILAGIAGILILRATDLGEVAVVQALDGLKFVFILLIAIVVGQKLPSACREDSCRRREIIQKALFVAIISFGYLILFI
ncbi:hypothetical protein KTR10_01690 [Candidatus Kaiserbacteria bacterium]|nr:hypothetical protein [Candidatus Kaiserbacteria bacterium]